MQRIKHTPIDMHVYLTRSIESFTDLMKNFYFEIIFNI